MTRLTALLSRVLQIGEESISDSASPSSIPSWDSFNGLMLVSELEAEFGVSFTMDEVTSVKCVGDIKAALKRHGVDPDA